MFNFKSFKNILIILLLLKANTPPPPLIYYHKYKTAKDEETFNLRNKVFNAGLGAAQKQKSVHDQYTLNILAVHKNQYNQYIKNSNVLINQYTKIQMYCLNSTLKDYFQYHGW